MNTGRSYVLPSTLRYRKKTGEKKKREWFLRGGHHRFAFVSSKEESSCTPQRADKGRRDREASVDQSRFSSPLFFFISLRDAPLYRASTLLRRRAVVAATPWFPTSGTTTFSLRYRRSWIGIDARCTRMHAPPYESRSRRAPMRTNNLTPRGGTRPSARCSFSRN